MDSDSDSNSDIENPDPAGAMLVPSVPLPVGNPVVSIMPHALAPVIRQHSPARRNAVPGTNALQDAVVPSLPFQNVNSTANPGYRNMPQSPDPRNQYSMTRQHIQDPSGLAFQANTGACQNAWSQQNVGNQLIINPAEQVGFQGYAQAQSPFNFSGQGHEAPGPSSVPFGGTRIRAHGPDYDLPPFPETFLDPYLFAELQPPPDPPVWFSNSQQNLQQLAQGQSRGPYSMNFQAPAQMAYHGHERDLLTLTQRTIADMRSCEENCARSSSVQFDPYAPRNPASVRTGSSSTPLQRLTAATGSQPAMPLGNQASHPSASVNPYAVSNLTLAQLESLTPLQRSNLHMSRNPWPMENQAPLIIPYTGSSSAPPQRPMAAMGSRQSLPAGNRASSSSAPLDPNAEMEHIRVNSLPDEEGHQLVGRNCYICKKDLSHPPEGPIVENQPLLPGATVLPCGHAFHTVCLDKITPETQKNDPPCLPCAIGDNE